MYIKELTNQEFKEFSNSFNKKSIFQTCEYAFVMNEEKFDSIFLGLIDNDAILAASLVLIKNQNNLKYAYAPRGFLIDYNNYDLLEQFTKLIKKYLKDLNIVSIKISPMIEKNSLNYNEIFNNLKKLKYKHLGYNNFFESLNSQFEAVLDINKPYYLLFKDIKKPFRTKIRSSENNGISVHKGNISHIEELYNHTSKKYLKELKYYKNICNFYNNSEIYFSKLDTYKYLKICTDNLLKQEDICNKLNKELKNNQNIINLKMANDLILSKYKSNLVEANKLINKYPEGIILSSCLIIKNDKEIYLLMDGYNTKFKRFNSKHILLWKLIEKYSNLGYQTFNFGGITNPLIENKKYKGLNEFKLSFNSNVIEYIGNFELATNKALYLISKTKKSK